MEAQIPAEWLKKLAEKYLTEEEKKQIEAMGGLDKLLETLKKRLAEQKGRHQGGSKWIGTAGTSPYRRLRLQSGRRAHRPGRQSQFPRGEGVGQARVQGPRRRRRARHPQHQDRAAPPAQVRPHRRAEELDLDGTIKGTAHKGYLDILMRPERHNAVKVLLFFDIGGSMDWHIKATEELFSAARSEFKHMEHFYFHNCLYEKVWKENRRRFQATYARPGTCCTPIRTTTRW